MNADMFKRYRSIRVSRGYRAADALRIARQEESAGKPAPWYGGATYHNSRGNWSQDRREFYCDNGKAPFRNVEDAKPDRGRVRYGWYCDDTQSNVCVPMVALISGRGWVSGLSWTGQDGETWFPCHAYDDRDDAVRAADSIAESYAERERDYQAGWRDGMTAREAQREAMGDALASVEDARRYRAAARAALAGALSARSGEESGFLPPETGKRFCAEYRAALVAMRAAMGAACKAREKAWREWRKAWPGRVRPYDDNPYCAGWHDGVVEA